MLKFTGRLVYIKFNKEKFNKTLDEKLHIQLRNAARAWLRAVIPNVPVYTGMARGSLAPLGRFLHVAVPISPIASRPGKSPEAGEQHSEFKFYRRSGQFVFSWNTTVLHYLINEFNDMSGILPLTHPTPWHSIAAGNAAFKLYVEQVIPKRLPNLGDFIEFETR